MSVCLCGELIEGKENNQKGVDTHNDIISKLSTMQNTNNIFTGIGRTNKIKGECGNKRTRWWFTLVKISKLSIFFTQQLCLSRLCLSRW